MAIPRLSTTRRTNCEEVATKIIKELKEHRRFITLHRLAKKLGFITANSSEFKDGLNYLITEGIVKFHQGGWPSEKRGGKQHPKGVILVSDIYELDQFDEEFKTEALECMKFDKESRQTALGQKPMDQRFKGFLTRIKKCENCQRVPIAYLTDEKIGICERHWVYLSHSDLEW